tara:strand:- start:2853 stop:3284 length:432 start_codon:yes stop_codon:yes gene_type:complete
MKSYVFLSLVAVLALTAPVAHGQPAGAGAEHQHQQRFEKMDSTIDEAQKLHGTARHAKMMEHMQMMREQMQAMHGMMGGMAGKDSGDGKMGQGQMKPGGMKPGQMGQMGGPQMMQNMQSRMDMMQKMMEQMHKQQELMLKDDS